MDLNELNNKLEILETVGKPISVDKYTTIVPISKVSYGYVDGGGGFNLKNDKKDDDKNKVLASGFGMTVTPLGILICGDKTSYIKIDESYNEDKWLNLVKSVVNQMKK